MVTSGQIISISYRIEIIYILRDLPFRPNRTIIFEHGIFFCNAWNATKFYQEVGIPMVTLHAKFERISTPYARCVTFGQ